MELRRMLYKRRVSSTAYPNLVPEKDRDTAGVRISYSHFLQHPEDNLWPVLAIEIGDRFSGNQFAKRLSAEAGLQQLGTDAVRSRLRWR